MVIEFLKMAALAFVALALAALVVNFCRRRLRKSRHGLSGLCHKSGGGVCASCMDKGEKKVSKPPKTGE